MERHTVFICLWISSQKQSTLFLIKNLKSQGNQVLLSLSVFSRQKSVFSRQKSVNCCGERQSLIVPFEKQMFAATIPKLQCHSICDIKAPIFNNMTMRNPEKAYMLLHENILHSQQQQIQRQVKLLYVLGPFKQ